MSPVVIGLHHPVDGETPSQEADESMEMLDIYSSRDVIDLLEMLDIMADCPRLPPKQLRSEPYLV